MEIVKTFSRQSIIMILLFFTLLLGMVNFACYYGFQHVFMDFSIQGKMDTQIPEVIALFEKMDYMHYQIKLYLMPVTSGVFLFFALLLWLVLRSKLRRTVNKINESM